MQKLINENGLSDKVFVDSAGTSGWHEGQQADSRMRQHGERRGLQLLSLSRPFAADDFDQFHHIFCMDRSNYQNLEQLARNESHRKKLHLMCDYAQNFEDSEVPDPYHGGEKDFEYVFDLLEDACAGAFQRIAL